MKGNRWWLSSIKHLSRHAKIRRSEQKRGEGCRHPALKTCLAFSCLKCFLDRCGHGPLRSLSHQRLLRSWKRRLTVFKGIGGALWRPPSLSNPPNAEQQRPSGPESRSRTAASTPPPLQGPRAPPSSVGSGPPRKRMAGSLRRRQLLGLAPLGVNGPKARLKCKKGRIKWLQDRARSAPAGPHLERAVGAGNHGRQIQKGSFVAIQ